jgi:hypothetical protein
LIGTKQVCLVPGWLRVVVSARNNHAWLHPEPA